MLSIPGIKPENMPPNWYEIIYKRESNTYHIYWINSEGTKCIEVIVANAFK